MAETPPSFRASLCTHQFELVESRRALVRRTRQQSDPSRSIPQRGRSPGRDRGVPERLEQKSKTVCLDCNGGVDHGKTLTLPTNPGEDSARLHLSTNQKREEITAHLFNGHYTSYRYHTRDPDQ